MPSLAIWGEICGSHKHFGAREPKIRLAFRGNKAGANVETPSSDPRLRFWMCQQIPYPVRGRILGDQEVVSVAKGKPDLDFARHTALAASSREVKILLSVDAIVP